MAFDTMSTLSPVSSEDQTSPQVTPDPTNKQDDYINEGVKDPRPHDVLCGRGGSINSHPGNERFRQLVDKRKRVYLTARFKREKRLIASSIVSEIRALDPPGRFLQMEKSSGLWRDIGDEKARDKTSQALRENAPKIRADIEEETLEKRAEMQKEEDVQRQHAAVAQQQHQHASPSAPPPQMTGYYPPHPGWGPYPPPPPSYYGYGHPHGAPPSPHGAPPPPHPSYYPPPPQQHASHHTHLPPHGTPWGYYPPPPTHSHPPQPQQQIPQAPKSSMAEYISSGAESVTESVKRWSSSFNFTGGDRGGSSDHHGDNHSVNSRPLPYVHEDSKKRRMVKFSSDTKRNNKRSYSRRNSANSMTNSILSGLSEDHDLEPHGMDEDIENRSLMSSVANHILGSIGSWDTASILCGVDNTDRDSAPFPGGRHENINHHQQQQHVQDGDMMDEDEMNVEWEGQEVQLMEKNDQDSVASEDRMPPPPRQVQHHDNHSMAFSSLGSCHSWMPEQFNDAASSFFGSIRGGSEVDQHHHHQGHDSHMEQQMDYSLHTENYSLGGSIGGNSLTRVFEHDPMPESTGSAMGTPNMNHRTLNQVPSWERNFRSRSPLSVGSDDADDISLISKESSKFSRESREGGISVSPVNTPRDGGSVWGTKE